LSLTLLLDLDDTLLKNNFEEFLPYYLEAFSKKVSPIIEPNSFVNALMESTRAMLTNRKPDCTLMEVFESSFYPKMNISKDNFQNIAESFYLEEFPKLQIHTKSIPEAIELVQTAQAKGFSISISTNPLFPMVAIEERLKWANLSQNDYQYELVSSFESFHFAKPDPTYFAELLARLGWPQGSILVVGDDIESDIYAANQLGLKTFLVNSDDEQNNSLLESATSHGSLTDLVEWIERTPLEQLLPDYSSCESILATLRSTPAALDTISRNLHNSNSLRNPREGEWGLTENFCHLRDVDIKVNRPRIIQILEKNNPFLPGVDTDKWADDSKYEEQDGGVALDEFIAARINLVKILETMDKEDWERPARHAIFGPTNLKELLSITASHDRAHMKQVNQIFQV
jgi:HAD superfamily hydrolase (TIGR01549 family)